MAEALEAETSMREPEKPSQRGDPVSPKPSRTALGARLLEIRKRIVASGEPLLSWAEIQREVAERRGEAQQPD